MKKFVMHLSTRHKQVDKDFNSPGELEVSMTSLSEVVANAILHRSYVIGAPLRVFIFDNRIEIHSPGLLPEGVNLDSIMHGASMPRNKLLFNHGINLLPYTGAGSGITRALKFTPDIKFMNDETLNEFVVTVERKDIDDRDNDRDGDREDRDKTLINSGLENMPDSKSDREDRDNDRDKHVEHKHASYKSLNGAQKNIIQFCSVPRSARDILDHIGYAYNSTNIANQIKPLLELGFLEMTEPEKPNSKNQKYRKVNRSS